MRYRIKNGSTVVANVSETDPVRIGSFSAPPGWIVGAPLAAIPGHTIEPYEPAPPPPPTPPTAWRVPWLVFLDRMADANAEAARVLVNGLPAKVSERVKHEGVPVDTLSPSQTETNLRTWLANNSEDPDVVLART